MDSLVLYKGKINLLKSLYSKLSQNYVKVISTGILNSGITELQLNELKNNLIKSLRNIELKSIQDIKIRTTGDTIFIDPEIYPRNFPSVIGNLILEYLQSYVEMMPYYTRSVFRLNYDSNHLDRCFENCIYENNIEGIRFFNVPYLNGLNSHSSQV